MAVSKVKQTKDNPNAAVSAANPVTPPRKTGKVVSRKAVKKVSAQDIKYNLIRDMEGVIVVKVFRPDSVQPSFYAPTIAAFEEDEDAKRECEIAFFSELRDPYGKIGPWKAVSSTGKEYTYDIAVIVLSDTTSGMSSYKEGVDKYTRKLNTLSQDVKDKYQYGTPKFANRGVVGTHATNVAYHYLLDDDCISLIKVYYDKCQTKEEFMENEFRGQILEQVFGDENIGMSVIDACTDEEWYEL